MSVTSGMPLTAVFIDFPTSRSESEITATLGADAIKVLIEDDTTGVFMVPSVDAGQRRLELPLGANELGVANFTVAAPPVIANPQAVADDKVEEIQEGVDSLVAQIRAGLLADLGAGEAQAAAIEAFLDDVKAQIASASSADITALAHFLEANASVFAASSASSVTPSGVSASSFDIEARVNAFMSEITAQKIELVAAIGVCAAAIVATGGWALVATGVCGGFLLDRAQRIVTRTKNFLQDNVFVPLTLALESASSQVVVAPAAASAGAAAALLNSSVDFDHRQDVELRFGSEYRSLEPGDRGSAGAIFGLLDDLRGAWDWVMGLLPDDASFSSYHLDDNVASRSAYVSLGGGSSVHVEQVSGASCETWPVDGGVGVRCDNTTASDQAVTLSVVHQNPYGEARTSVSGWVYRNQPSVGIIQSGDEQSAAQDAEYGEALVVQFVDSNGEPVASHPVSWWVSSGSGSLTSSEGSTDGSGLARATVRAGSSGTLQVAVAATDRWGAQQVAYFSLAVEEPSATLTLTMTGVGSSFVTSGTDHAGNPSQQLHCRVSMAGSVSGNTPITLVSYNFKHLRSGVTSETNTYSAGGTTLSPGWSGTWLADEGFWFNYPVDEALSLYTTQYWVEYTVAGESKTARTEWQCSP